jgi:hypothetical protein
LSVYLRADRVEQLPIIEQMADVPKPPSLAVNLEWQLKGTGFDLRRVVYTGRKRRRLYVCHLSQMCWQQMCERHFGDDLAEALRQRAKSFRR